MGQSRPRSIFGNYKRAGGHDGSPAETADDAELLISSSIWVFKHGCVPDILKKGLLHLSSKTRRPMSCLPTTEVLQHCQSLNKIIEAIIRDRINQESLKIKNPTQRGFTAKSSPLNAGLVVEEVYREPQDSNQEFELVLLDAKSAFDVVVHSHLMRRLFHLRYRRISGGDNTEMHVN
ncbi:unnamed protein product [Mytilus edulis]|uniref:Reverse transcriptase domain-containing protein n=1 Tax=Mytilus edulis TaxID=6550 RepID=A0A8S3VHQ5_MYTED|nr:unnamed protein product [Mytilus edulis]